jgi:2',3'-cyclic-nucleotide 2'-phosphodiesterase (5'-nucleotidase family)
MDRTTVKRLAVVLALGLIALGGGAGAPAGRRLLWYAHSGFSQSTLAQQNEASEAAEQDESASPRARAPLTILQINDVYSAVPIDGVGGLARVATLKQKLAAAGRTPLLVLAGDFLSPSVASSVFKGEQMVAALNAAGLDLATLGNHEFDFGSDLLIRRMGEARWQWVVTNVIDTNTGKPVGGALPYLVKTFGTLKVGFIGLCLTTTEISRDKLTHLRLVDPIEAAGRYLPALRREGANIIVAITHLKFSDDRALARKFPQIDLIIGGHEHYPITATENRTLISKAGSDAKFVARIDVNRQTSGVVERFFEMVPITSALADEPRTAAVVKSYEDRLGTELNTVVATSRVPLDADTLRLRAGETNLGDLFADAMRAAANADITIVNSGSIRGDRVFPAGAITRRTVIEMHPFGGVICKVAVTGRIVLQALDSGVAKLPVTAGQFPQVSGLTMRVATDAVVGHRVSDVRVGGQPLDPNKVYTVALTDYMLMGGDDYAMFVNQPVVIGPEAGGLIVTALEKYMADRVEVAPAADGRIAITR